MTEDFLCDKYICFRFVYILVYTEGTNTNHMLDIRFIREHKEVVEMAAKKKRVSVDVAALLALDDERRAIMTSLEAKRAQQGTVGAKIAQASPEEKVKLMEEMKVVKEAATAEEEKLKEVMKGWQALMLQVPNIPDISVPDGEDDASNVEVKQWGEKTKFDFTPKDHITLMEELDMVDLDRGTKVAGFRGYVLKNQAVILSLAIWRFAVDHFSSKGFQPLIVPSLVKRENLLGTGFVPQGEEDLYKTQDGEYLAGTGEVATMGLLAEEVLDMNTLPRKYLAFSPCFRREAGSHSKDVKGLIRVHEFFKWEQVIICEGSHEASVAFHEELNRNTEEFIEKLNIPYHTVLNCGGDLGLGQVKKYDIELWVPKEEKYREISSASYFHDFQTRRLGIRYKDAEGKLKFTHSLNCTAIPTPRILVSLIENYQNADGSITIPPALVPYTGFDKITKAN